MAGTAFGPQSRGAVSLLPSTVNANRYGTVDTWFADCAAGQAPTQANAQWFNMVTGNMRNLVKGAIKDGATFAVNDGEMDMVLNAVKYYAENSGVRFVGQTGVLTLSADGRTVDISIPALQTYT